MPDIDIDFVDRDQALTLFKHIPASRKDNGKLVKHNTGVYLHPVPVDPVTGLCSIPYEQAEDEKYFKIDFLNVGIYKGVRDETHLVQLMETEPLWDLLEQDDFVNAWRYNPEDPTDFRGTIICRPCYDPPSQTLSDWERLDYDHEGSMDETREW